MPKPEQNISVNQVNNSGLVSFPSRYDDGERTLTCPTCGGSGRLTQEHENDLVALIPVRDNRLKPRRKVYIFIALLVLILVTGTITGVFLFPRDITMKVITTKAVNISFPQSNHSTPSIIINSTVQLTNSNYFEVTLDRISQQFTWDQHYVAADESFPGLSITVPSQSTVKHSFLVKTKYPGDEAKKIRKVCCWTNVLFMIDSNAQAAGLTVAEGLTNRVFMWIDCEPSYSHWNDDCLK